MYEIDTKSLINEAKTKTIKKEILRYNEYYNIQSTLDNLYNQSQAGSSFKHLYKIISSKENILLAYRTIKRNTGSKTPGTNHHNIKYWEDIDIDKYILYIQSRLNNYLPQPIKTVEIPKSNGKTRPLGIPCIEDRLIQQCIKQVLDPICEAKFFEHSYGFRPNRNTKHAIAYMMKKVNIDKCYYIVDVDIKGFFDNVNHSKLLKQLWTIGIHDKKVLSIINAMLKAEVKGIGVSSKGVTQGGILSPLLANVVLNEFDQWIASQWQYFPTNRQYPQSYNKYRNMRKSNLKEIYLVRYADDFKIFCKNKNDAEKIFHASQKWLNERLSLEISSEKSKIVDIRKDSSNFLGFKFKAYKKSNKWIIKSHMADKAKDKVTQTIKEQIEYIWTHQKEMSVDNLNKIISGLHNYYKSATETSQDFSDINYNLSKRLSNRLKQLKSKTGFKTQEYKIKYKDYKGKEINILNVTVYPISYISNSPPILFNQKVCNYTDYGRRIVHTKLKNVNISLMNFIMNNSLKGAGVELNDNRLSLFAAQKGRCAITNKMMMEDLEVHHIIPKSLGGTDRYNNLILINPSIHKLIHLRDEMKISYYLNLLELSSKSLRKLNKYRSIVGNEIIMIE